MEMAQHSNLTSEAFETRPVSPEWGGLSPEILWNERHGTPSGSRGLAIRRQCAISRPGREANAFESLAQPVAMNVGQRRR